MLTATLISTLALHLALEPPTSDHDTAELPTLAGLERAIHELEPSEAAESLLRGGILEAQRDAWGIAGSPEALEVLVRARLALVWSLINRSESEAAEAAMDEAIRSAMGRAMPTDMFGPEIHELYDARRRALRDAGTASIHVDCQRCQVVINEHRSPNPSEPLYLGSYRVWVSAGDRGEPLLFTVELSEAGVGAIVEATTEIEPSCEAALPPPALVAEPKARPALGPVGLTGALMISGGVATTVGGVLLMSLPAVEWTGRGPWAAGSSASGSRPPCSALSGSSSTRSYRDAGPGLAVTSGSMSHRCGGASSSRPNTSATRTTDRARDPCPTTE